jgi:putative inorganic carbon (hco3(-)) transporter
MALIELEASGPAVGQKEELAPRIALSLTFASAAAILLSIAASQILMGAALLVAALSGRGLRMPRFFKPLLLFLAITVLADLFSGDARAGLPQIRKFYVFAIALLAYTFLNTTRRILALALAWTAAAFLSSLLGIHQFLARLAEARRLYWNIYEYVLDKRMTGFASHWMTFGGEQMIALLLLTSLLLFGGRSRWKPVGWAAWLVILASLVLGMTRSVYLAGFPAGLGWLLWHRRKATVWALPVLGVIAFFSVPGHVRERIVSVARPHGNVDSNGRRMIMARAGWAMVRQHPWLGIGPEQPGRQFDRYVPASVPRPLPKGWYGHLHNIYLQYAAERGVPALLVLLWAIATAAADCRRGLRNGVHYSRGDRVWILHGALAVIIAVLVEGLFEHNLGDSEILTMFLIVLGCASAAVKGAERCG